uniref:Uncharacterized protein n=1 Tax=Candidatus Kentrum sp. UNK TaxID=2126344 RepID=A0A451A5A1_9GAMM|nr:MAG: hypothetical protein BECKUNK1418G_GA0071005_10168 [Candidatus Kentron sp. UNK]VFK69808.1 MAG: hypothetical protein BECKUNK1418H_GA0071006_101925 [Candidatus Kentron sp. UNK]
MYFEITGKIANVETIAVGGNIRDITRIQKQHGFGRWKKLKGIAVVRPAIRSYSYCRGALARSPWYRQKKNEDQAILGLICLFSAQLHNMDQVLQNIYFALPIPSHALSVRGEASLASWNNHLEIISNLPCASRTLIAMTWKRQGVPGFSR